MKNYKKIIAMVAAGLVCAAVTSNAALTPNLTGTSTTIAAGAAGQYTPGAGSVIATIGSPYNVTSTGGTDIGTLYTQVWSGDNTGLGGLDFIYTLVLTSGAVSGITVDGFGGQPVQIANYISAANTTLYGAPTQPIANAAYAAGNINANPGGDFTAGQVLSFIVATTSLTYGVDSSNVQDGTAAQPNIYAPVPEASTVMAGALMLLPFGIGVIRSLRKERTA
jgi:hypothetical protein